MNKKDYPILVLNILLLIVQKKMEITLLLKKSLELIKLIIQYILVAVMDQKILAEVKIIKLYLWRQW